MVRMESLRLKKDCPPAGRGWREEEALFNDLQRHLVPGGSTCVLIGHVSGNILRVTKYLLMRPLHLSVSTNSEL